MRYGLTIFKYNTRSSQTLNGYILTACGIGKNEHAVEKECPMHFLMKTYNDRIWHVAPNGMSMKMNSEFGHVSV